MDSIEQGIYMGAGIFLFIMAMTLLLIFVDLYDESILFLNRNINSGQIVKVVNNYE